MTSKHDLRPIAPFMANHLNCGMTMDPSEVPDRLRPSDYLLCAAVASLWLFAAGIAVPNAYEQGEYTRLVLFGVGSIGFLANACGLLRHWYARRGFKAYFIHQTLAMALAILALYPYGPVWLMVMPAAAQAVMVLPLRATLAILSVHLLLVFGPLALARGDKFWLEASNILSSFSFTVGCSYVLRRERLSRVALAAANEKLEAYSKQVRELTVAEERNRLAQELHDGAAHHLTSANMLIAGAIAGLSSSEDMTRQTLDKAQGQVRAALGELRSAVAQRFEAESREPLVLRLQQLVNACGTSAVLEVEGTPEPDLSLEKELALYRVAQESLTNATKHAPGMPIVLRIDFTTPGRVVFTAENDEPAQTPSEDGAVGLLSLRHRMERLDGSFRAGVDHVRKRFVVRAELSR